MLHHGEGDFTLQEEATTSIQHKAKRSKKHKHKREMVSFMHFLYNDHFLAIQLMSILTQTCKAIKPEGDEKLVLKPTMSNQRLQGAQLMYFECK